MIFDNVLETIGRTPVVRLRCLDRSYGSEILIKLESFNPAGSIKDRPALQMITAAERDGRLRPGGTIVESSSGNMGKALALIGAVSGYRVIIVVDPKAPESMLKFVAALGAEVEVVRQPDENGGYQRPRRERVEQLVASIPGAFWPNQMHNPDNPRAHAENTARELLDDVPQFDVLMATASTGGHISGLARTVKEKLPEVTTVAVDAVGSAAFGHRFHGYVMRGLGLAWRPGNLEMSLVDRVHLVDDSEGIATSRLLARTEGLMVGESAGAAIFAALHHAQHHPGSRIVVVAADGAVNYLGESFDDGWLQAKGLAGRIAAAGLGDLDGLLAAARDPSHPSVAVADLLALT
ncbi:PLP-dependent cysteine synthase family protein [Couchioplanes caeruleus]|uniref:Pyridoxal-phosphate dependent protein n=2 Tax=Couchioplanes caeruleus TaxID=56438 RepID=A0A1K0GXM4_9ACTN|nr:cysteine synthase family protein [Couchioplanes caeruleus]OJF09561.1 pyridoxal-phosphate dependent protein [Couchioplanes caeruleus subsp. caeruleus]OJF16180.1 pyridoxal-phosphate dependent protein [Couchioplanes caeruleus subsp. caeruleus]ROP34076.1 cystathionine beta-synthase/cysteine synthase A [Couchioplanes caeruleus]